MCVASKSNLLTKHIQNDRFLRSEACLSCLLSLEEFGALLGKLYFFEISGY